MPGRLSIQAFELVSNRRAGELGSNLREEGRAFFEAKQNCAHHFAGKAVRSSRNGIRFVNQRGNAAHPSGQNWRGRSESTHTEDDLRFEFLVNRSAAGKAFGKPANESENLRRINRRKTNGWQFFEPELRPGRERQGVDLLFGNEQEHFVSAFAQNFSNGDSGKEMPTRTSACNDRVHNVILPTAAGSAAPRAMLKKIRLRRVNLTSRSEPDWHLGLLDPPLFASFIR